MDRRPSVRFECGTHGAMGVIQARTRSACRDAEGLGDLRRCKPEVMVEDEDRPLFWRQPLEATLEHVPVGRR